MAESHVRIEGKCWHCSWTISLPEHWERGFPGEIVASFRSSNQASAIGAPLLLEGDFQPATVEEAKTVEGAALQSPATCAAVARLNRHKTLLGNGQARCH